MLGCRSSSDYLLNQLSGKNDLMVAKARATTSF